MSALPEQYQRYAQLGQPAVRHGAVELYDEVDPIVYVADPYDPRRSIPVRQSSLLPAAPTPPRDLTPQPLIDPVAQRMFAGGVGVGAAGAGLGFGAGQLAAGIAMMGTSGMAILLGLLLAVGSLRGRGVVNIHNEVHQHARWGGKNHTEL
ncbi:hypothetical protein [Streptomyces spinosisporus]|uniref:Integral membrane protein n=1 Tax=Streptomyces spinosisporus TaxID=2927582 RepID=A0ABS9XW73_9ACTN|nr:hypothetical protein [Streptomyces spinosisporus]MCI3246333.1 hypothetical protein [Streptomyces spinosisporus]